VTRILVTVFAYLPSFISQILDFIYWPVFIFILIYFELRDTENQQYRETKQIITILSNKLLNSYACMYGVSSINIGDLSEAASMIN